MINNWYQSLVLLTSGFYSDYDGFMKSKVVTGAASVLVFLLNAAPALAVINVQVQPNTPGVDPNTPVTTVLNSALRIVFILAALLVLFFLILGAFRWITSGGEKEGVSKARSTIVNALIGLAILALAFFIVTVVGQLLDINILGNFQIPNLEGR